MTPVTETNSQRIPDARSDRFADQTAFMRMGCNKMGNTGETGHGPVLET